LIVSVSPFLRVYSVASVGSVSFGGSLNVPHATAVDSRGNIYVGENLDARRFQRFLFKGVGTPKPDTNPPTTLVKEGRLQAARHPQSRGATSRF